MGSQALDYFFGLALSMLPSSTRASTDCPKTPVVVEIHQNG
jgi:hypothetical protein